VVAPLSDAVIVALPDATPHTGNDPVIAPEGTLTEACTVATPGLLLVSPTVTPPLPAALDSVTVPWMFAPAATLDAARVTLAMPPFVGVVGDPEPHAAPVIMVTTTMQRRYILMHG
jgi:hypothetical protein